MTDARADAPGRVNLIGEHTDYHHGFVLPAVIPQRTTVTLRRRDDRLVQATSDASGMETSSYELGHETRGRGWVDYVQGVTSALARRGLAIPGFDLRVTSCVPVGGGVSSSAALEVALLRALRLLNAWPLDDVEIARVAQEAETVFVGAPVGIMDQMACSLGHDGEALFLDTENLVVERVPLAHAGELVVIDSGIAHRHAGGEYAARRAESFAAAAALGVTRLREVSARDLPRIAALPPLLCRRARHIVTENDRVRAAVAALRAGDLAALGALFNASHASMRDDYEVSTPEMDRLVAIGQAHPDIYGARMTGGGFGGAAVMLARRGRGATAAAAVAQQYATATGRAARVLVPADPTSCGPES